MPMRRIFPNVIELYDQIGTFDTEEQEDKAYQTYCQRLPTVQEFYRKVSNHKAIQAGVRMGIVTTSRHAANKKKIIALRRVMNMMRRIEARLPCDKDPAPYLDSICYGLSCPNKNGLPAQIWIEYLWNSLDVIAGSKFDIEDDDAYQVAIAFAEYIRSKRYEEVCDFYQRNQNLTHEMRQEKINFAISNNLWP